jgi:hypothetical protein
LEVRAGRRGGGDSASSAPMLAGLLRFLPTISSSVRRMGGRLARSATAVGVLAPGLGFSRTQLAANKATASANTVIKDERIDVDYSLARVRITIGKSPQHKRNSSFSLAFRLDHVSPTT